MPENIDPVEPLRGILYAVTSPGGQKMELYDLCVNYDLQQVRFLKVGSPGSVVHYHQIEVPTPAGTIEIVLPGDIEQLASIAEKALLCHIPAELKRQAWINDHAVDTGEPPVSFSALPALVGMTHGDMISMFERREFDVLAGPIISRLDFEGPYTVSIDQSEFVKMVCLVSGYMTRYAEGATTDIIDERIWKAFQARAPLIHLATIHEIPPLDIDGNVFRLLNQLGGVCSVFTTWARPFEDDAVRLAMTQLETQVLALHSAGVLFDSAKWAYNPKVVQALKRVADEIPRLIERLDEDEGQGAWVDMRPRG